MSGPYQGRDLSNCGVGRLRAAIHCGVLSVKAVFVSRVRDCLDTAFFEAFSLFSSLIVKRLLCLALNHSHLVYGVRKIFR